MAQQSSWVMCLYGQLLEWGKNTFGLRCAITWTACQHVNCQLTLSIVVLWLGTSNQTGTRKFRTFPGAEEAKSPQGKPTHSTWPVLSHGFFLDGRRRYVPLRQGDHASVNLSYE